MAETSDRRCRSWYAGLGAASWNDLLVEKADDAACSLGQGQVGPAATRKRRLSEVGIAPGRISLSVSSGKYSVFAVTFTNLLRGVDKSLLGLLS